MTWISTAFSFVVWVAGLFGYGKKADPVADAQATGEKLGKLETENAALKNFVETEQKVGDAGAAVRNDPDSVFDDPANRNNPASPYYHKPRQ